MQATLVVRSCFHDLCVWSVAGQSVAMEALKHVNQHVIVTTQSDGASSINGSRRDCSAQCRPQETKAVSDFPFAWAAEA
jgi:hypothetical protein